MRPRSNLSKKILSLRSFTIVDVRALPGVDCSRLVIVVQLHRKDATMSIRHWMLRIRGWVVLNILDTVRDPIRNLVHANGGSDLTKDWCNISGMVSFINQRSIFGCTMIKESLDKNCPLIG